MLDTPTTSKALYIPPIEHRTKTYFPNPTLCLRYSSHWVCDVTGDKVKLSMGLKEYYFYRLMRYEYFHTRDGYYKESHQRVADTLGIGIDVIKKNYQPLLVRMGLIKSVRTSVNTSEYTINELSSLNGWLVNERLCKYEKPKQYDNDQAFTYENLKNLEHNKALAKKVKHRNDVKFRMVEDSTVLELMKYKRMYKELVSEQ